MAKTEQDLSIQMSGERGERSELAIQRTMLANTRTFSAWIRTGLAAVLAGLSIVNFIADIKGFHGFILTIGLLFVFIGIIIYLAAFLNYKKSNETLLKDGGKPIGSLAFPFFVTAGMTLAAILITALLVFI